MVVNIKKYLEEIVENDILFKETGFTSKEINFMNSIKTEFYIRDKKLIENLNPVNNYCVISVGALHVLTAVNKLQNLGYYALKCLDKNIKLNLIGLECRSDGKEIC